MRSETPTPRPESSRWISGTLRCSTWRKAPTNEGYYVEAELTLGQRESALLLGPARLLVEIALWVHAATDHQSQAHQPRERGDGASVVVSDPQLLCTDQATVAEGFEPQFGGGFWTALVSCHRDFSRRRGRLRLDPKEDRTLGQAGFAVLEKKEWASFTLGTQLLQHCQRPRSRYHAQVVALLRSAQGPLFIG